MERVVFLLVLEISLVVGGPQDGETGRGSSTIEQHSKAIMMVCIEQGFIN